MSLRDCKICKKLIPSHQRIKINNYNPLKQYIGIQYIKICKQCENDYYNPLLGSNQITYDQRCEFCNQEIINDKSKFKYTNSHGDSKHIIFYGTKHNEYYTACGPCLRIAQSIKAPIIEDVDAGIIDYNDFEELYNKKIIEWHNQTANKY